MKVPKEYEEAVKREIKEILKKGYKTYTIIIPIKRMFEEVEERESNCSRF